MNDLNDQDQHVIDLAAKAERIAAMATKARRSGTGVYALPGGLFAQNQPASR